MKRLMHCARPQARYGMAYTGWMPASDWEVVNGRFQRMWRGPRRSRRRAVITRESGVWTWFVFEWRRGAWCEVSRALHYTKRQPYWCAQQARPFADLAARST